MIVLDASVLIDLLFDIEPFSGVIERRIRKESPNLFAPHLLDAEVAQVIRGYLLRREVSKNRAILALEDYLDLPIFRFSHTPLLKRAFELRNNVTIYDAIYISLAEGLGIPLLTRDNSLVKLPGVKAEVEIVS